jgi:hypothetical protein
MISGQASTLIASEKDCFRLDATALVAELYNHYEVCRYRNINMPEQYISDSIKKSDQSMISIWLSNTRGINSRVAHV